MTELRKSEKRETREIREGMCGYEKDRREESTGGSEGGILGEERRSEEKQLRGTKSEIKR